MNKLYALIQERGYTTSELSFKLGYRHRSAFGHVIRGNKKMGVDKWQVLAITLGLPLEQVLSLYKQEVEQ
jgi:hypothetical protein